MLHFAQSRECALDRRTEMRTRLLLTALTILAAAPAQAQRDGGIPTETMERLAGERDRNLPYNILGLFGLLGLLGLRRGHSEDSYHPSPLD